MKMIEQVVVVVARSGVAGANDDNDCDDNIWQPEDIDDSQEPKATKRTARIETMANKWRIEFRTFDPVLRHMFVR
jgi:hypothetical protein